MAEIIDISVPLSPSTVSWENESTPVIERVSSIEAGDGYNLSRLVLGTHTGTHVDAPLHFIGEGGSVDRLPLDALIGPALVVDACDVAVEIDVELVERELRPAASAFSSARETPSSGTSPVSAATSSASRPRPQRSWSRAASGSSASTTSRSALPRHTASCSPTTSSVWKGSTCVGSRRVATDWSASPFASSAPTALPPAPY